MNIINDLELIELVNNNQFLSAMEILSKNLKSTKSKKKKKKLFISMKKLIEKFIGREINKKELEYILEYILKYILETKQYYSSSTTGPVAGLGSGSGPLVATGLAAAILTVLAAVGSYKSKTPTTKKKGSTDDELSSIASSKSATTTRNPPTKIIGTTSGKKIVTKKKGVHDLSATRLVVKKDTLKDTLKDTVGTSELTDTLSPINYIKFKNIIDAPKVNLNPDALIFGTGPEVPAVTLNSFLNHDIIDAPKVNLNPDALIFGTGPEVPVTLNSFLNQHVVPSSSYVGTGHFFNGVFGYLNDGKKSKSKKRKRKSKSKSKKRKSNKQKRKS